MADLGEGGGSPHRCHGGPLVPAVLLIPATQPAIAFPTFPDMTGGTDNEAAPPNPDQALTATPTCAERIGERYAAGGGGTALTTTIASSNEPGISWCSRATRVQGAVPM